MTTSDERGQVGRLMQELRRRQRVVNGVRGAAWGVLVGGAVGCVVVLVAWIMGRGGAWGVLPMAGLAALACVAGGAAIGALSRVHDLALARSLDRVGNGQDRFASAWQLLSDSHPERARLVVQDALAHLEGASARAALPMRLPKSARWAAVPFVVMVALVVLLPQGKLKASEEGPPEISQEQWKEIADEFNKELAKLPKALTPEEQEFQKELENLAEKLKQAPDKKEALKDIARLSERVEREQRAMSPKEMSLRKAAKAVAKSAALKQLASKMQEGQYREASQELTSVADKMQNDELSPDAEEFEAMAQDLEKLSKELEQDQEMAKEAMDSAAAASKMNKKELSEALKRMAEQMKKNAGKYEKRDNLERHRRMLEELKRRMNSGKCENPGDGEGEGEGEEGDKPGRRAGKGGLKAGWGSMAKWDGGNLGENKEKRAGEMTDTPENAGESSSFQTVSPDEKAKSQKRYAELYAEFANMSEADLDLESVPAAQREYLRKYFNSIKPKEAEAGKGEKAPGKP